jgi:Arc/MetJ-type ribon-helix-helix transcriptional regulator
LPVVPNRRKIACMDTLTVTLELSGQVKARIERAVAAGQYSSAAAAAAGILTEAVEAVEAVEAGDWSDDPSIQESLRGLLRDGFASAARGESQPLDIADIKSEGRRRLVERAGIAG